MKFSNKQIKAYLDGILSGKITTDNLPEDLYFAIADYLKKGLYDGFGMDLKLSQERDIELLEELRNNVYMFSAAKTYQQTKAISEQLVDTDGNIRSRAEFNKVGREMFDTWNNDWGTSEYNTALAQGTMGVKWVGIEEDKKLFPNLRYSTIGDACQICAPLDGLVAPVDDPIWDEIYPANHFNCECTVLQEDDSVETTAPGVLKDLVGGATEKMDDSFINNVGKTGSVFPKDHPYFEVGKADRELARNNFNLPIPDTDE